MVGRDVNLRANRVPVERGRAVLRVNGLHVCDDVGQEKVRGVSLDVHAGEIVGIAGVDGNGQSQLAEAIMHLRPALQGQVFLDEREVTRLTVAQHRALGLSYIPADRRHVGAVTEMSVADNAILGSQRQRTRGLFLDRRKIREYAERLVARFGVRASGIGAMAGKLSGGNLQKLILGREILQDAAAIVVEQPTRGLDVGAVESVWLELLRERERGKAILLISAELEELMNLADRIAVMFEGRIVGILDAASVTQEKLGLMISGASMKLIERRLTPADSPLAITTAMVLAVLAAMLVTSLLFVLYGANPFRAYFALFHEPFATMRGFGYTLVRTAPLTLIALGTIVSWRSGFGYLGFEGCFVIGAAATSWLALATAPAEPWAAPLVAFLPLVLLLSFAAGAVWAGVVALIRARFGGNEVLISLMTNYVAILIVQYLVSGPMRAPGGVPETALLPRATWLPFILPGTRAHAGILLALLATLLVWMLLRKTPLGYELIVSGLSPSAARYGGINVGVRLVLAAFFAGGLGALAGTVEVLGEQHRLMDGISGGVGFTGIIVALLAKLNPLAVIPAAVLYGGMTVGANAMQRRAGIPSSITFILQSLIVLMVLASDIFRRYRVKLT